jgi:hypothetical protein
MLPSISNWHVRLNLFMDILVGKEVKWIFERALAKIRINFNNILSNSTSEVSPII